MQITELKDKVESGALELQDTQVWKLADDSSLVIAEQYLHRLCADKGLELRYIDSFGEIPDASFIADTNLYVLKTDSIDRIEQHDNCVVLCKSTKIKDTTVIPKLEDWQMVDYACALVKGIKKVELEWLIAQYNGNYMMFLSDIRKLTSVPETQQQSVYEQMLADGQFSDHTSLNIWDITNGIIKRDKKTVAEALRVIGAMDIEPLGFATALYKGFKNVIEVQLNPKATAESTGMSSKQFYAVSKYNCGHYTKEELVRIFKLLTSVEYMFKYESLDIDNIIDYLIVNIMGV